MKTITTVLLVALALAACGGCDDDSSRKESKPERMAVTWNADGTYRLVLRFDANELGGWVDEKHVIMPTHSATVDLVEYFGMDGWEYTTDAHQFVPSMVPGVIVEGKLYPARQSGGNLDANQFGILASNLDGSFVTTDNPQFPYSQTPDWYAAHPIAGQVTERGDAIIYRTESRADGLLVTWGGVDHWFAKS